MVALCGPFVERFGGFLRLLLGLLRSRDRACLGACSGRHGGGGDFGRGAIDGWLLAGWACMKSSKSRRVYCMRCSALQLVKAILPESE